MIDRATRLLLLAVLLQFCGCASTPSAPIRSDRATLVLNVKAQSKDKWKDPRKDPDYASRLRPGEAPAFELVNYDELEEVVVWLKVEHPSDAIVPSKRILIDTANVDLSLRAGALSDGWLIRNSSNKPESLYVRDESGDVLSLGTIEPGAERTFKPRASGLTMLMSDWRDQPVAKVFVIPIVGEPERYVRVVTSGKPITFNDLIPGAVTIMSWHERLPGSSLTVNLEPGKKTNATITVGVNSLPKAP